MPRLATIISCILAIAVIFITGDWKKDGEVINHDVKHYYAYLPATFIHHDLKVQNSTYYDEKEKYYYWTEPGPNNSKVFKTSCGVAYLYAPFFFIADVYANYCTDRYLRHGYSAPYKLALQLSAVFYLFWAFYFLEKILVLLNFSRKTVFATLLLLGTGTHLLCYASVSGPYSHVYSMFLITVFVYLTMLWYSHPSVKLSILTGLCIGLITLIRPTNIIIGIVFLLYDVRSFRDFRERILYLLTQYRFLLLMVPFFFAWWIPQFAYWKYVTGQWLYYPYGEEGFFWLHPKFYHGLVGFRKGWLIYTPLMWITVAGLFLLRRRLPQLRSGILLFTFFNMYIMFSWWCWWYGGSFGMRPMIDSYGLLAIPFAATAENMTRWRLWARIATGAVIVFFIWLNIFQMFQYHKQVLHYDSMNQRLYFKQFGKMERVDDFWESLSPPDYDKARKSR